MNLVSTLISQSELFLALIELSYLATYSYQQIPRESLSLCLCYTKNLWVIGNPAWKGILTIMTISTQNYSTDIDVAKGWQKMIYNISTNFIFYRLSQSIQCQVLVKDAFVIQLTLQSEENTTSCDLIQKLLLLTKSNLEGIIASVQCTLRSLVSNQYGQERSTLFLDVWTYAKALKQIWEDCGPPSFYLYFKWKSKPVTHGQK